MELVLLRHGKAENGNPQGDAARVLLEKGREQARRAARSLKAAGVLPDLVLTSPFVRAKQTAEEFCLTAEMPGPVLQSWIASGMHPETAMKELAAFHDFKRVMIVGHEPDFSALIEWILGVTGGGVEVKKGAVACLRVLPPTRYGNLLYLFPPRLADESWD
jgi:phosphohistidine phosphatase